MSNSNNLIVDDGDFSELVETERCKPEFPFINNTPPDRYARIHQRTFEVARASYVPAIQDRTSVTNFLTYSEDFTNAAWTKNSATAAANIRANPSDGLTTMGRLLEVAANAEHSFSRAYTFTAAAAHTLFVHVAPGLGRDWLRLKANDGTTNFTCFFDLANGRGGTAANCTGEIIGLDDGSFLCAITFAPLAAVGSITLNVASDGATVAYAGDITKGLYFWGAQLKLGARGAYVSTTDASRTALVPLVDAEDPFAFLVMEGKPDAIGGDILQIPRTFARLARPQTTYPGSRYISLPTPQNQYGAGGALVALAAAFNQSLGEGHFQGNVLYTSADRKLYRGLTPSAVISAFALAGTFTISYGASTTGALAYGAADGTIAAAINALGDVGTDGVVVGVGNNLSSLGFLAITMTFPVIPATWPKKFTMNAAGLTVNTSKNPVTLVVSGNSQIIYLPAHMIIPAHAFDAAKDLAAVNTNLRLLAFPTAFWGVIDADTIWLPTFSAASGNWAIAGPYVRRLPSGSRLARTRIPTSFYLPGFSLGIMSPTDIAGVAGLQNPDDMLNALVNLTGWQDYDSAGPTPWMAGLIHQMAITQINLDDF